MKWKARKIIAAKTQRPNPAVIAKRVGCDASLLSYKDYSVEEIERNICDCGNDTRALTSGTP